MHACVHHSVMILCDPMDGNPPGSLCPWNSPSKNAGVGSHSLLQGIFPTQRPNPGLLHCRQTLYHLSHQGSPYKCYYRINFWKGDCLGQKTN